MQRVHYIVLLKFVEDVAYQCARDTYNISPLSVRPATFADSSREEDAPGWNVLGDAVLVAGIGMVFSGGLVGLGSIRSSCCSCHVISLITPSYPNSVNAGYDNSTAGFSTL